MVEKVLAVGMVLGFILAVPFVILFSIIGGFICFNAAIFGTIVKETKNSFKNGIGGFGV